MKKQDWKFDYKNICSQICDCIEPAVSSWDNYSHKPTAQLICRRTGLQTTVIWLKRTAVAFKQISKGLQITVI